MAVAVGIGIFIVVMIICLSLGYNILYAMLFGLVVFIWLGRRMGHSFSALYKMSIRKCKTALIIWKVFFFIGMMTGLWRASGTVSWVIVNGIRVIPPDLFVLASFILASIMGMMMGTSFGVSSTVGVMLMAIARSGGVNELVVAGAIISGAFLGDRCSPASSCATLVAAITGTNLYDNIKMLLKTLVAPLFAALIGFGILSWLNPISTINESLLGQLQNSFDLRAWVLIPAAFMLVLPACRVPVRLAMAASVIVSLILTVVLQGMPALDAVKVAILGYHPEGELANVLSGGGLISLVNPAVIVMVTSCYSGIIEGTDMLSSVSDLLDKLAKKVGEYPAMVAISLINSMIFCNQTIVVMLSQQLMQKTYDRVGATNTEIAVDLSNASMMIAGWIPWSIAVGTPLSMLGVGWGAVPYILLIWFLPILYWPTRRLFYRHNET